MDDEAILYGNSSKNMNGSTSSSTESISHLCIISRENGRIEVTLNFWFYYLFLIIFKKKNRFTTYQI